MEPFWCNGWIIEFFYNKTALLMENIKGEFSCQAWYVKKGISWDREHSRLRIQAAVSEIFVIAAKGGGIVIISKIF